MENDSEIRPPSLIHRFRFFKHKILIIFLSISLNMRRPPDKSAYLKSN